MKFSINYCIRMVVTAAAVGLAPSPAQALSFTIQNFEYTLKPGQPGSGFPIIGTELSKQTGNIQGTLMVEWTQTNDEANRPSKERLYEFLANSGSQIMQDQVSDGIINMLQTQQLDGAQGQFQLNFFGQTDTGTYKAGKYKTSFDLEVVWHQPNVNSGNYTNLYQASGLNTWQIEPVPGPLPILGLGAVFGYSRKLRKLIKSSKPELIRTTVD